MTPVYEYIHVYEDTSSAPIRYPNSAYQIGSNGTLTIFDRHNLQIDIYANGGWKKLRHSGKTVEPE